MIKPALSAKQWEKRKFVGNDDIHLYWDDERWNEKGIAIQDCENGGTNGTSLPEVRHAIAAAALDKQAFGFNPPTDENGYTTPDYAWAIRECADALDRLLRTTPFGMQDDRSIASFAVGFARSAADRIEALIPKKDK